MSLWGPFTLGSLLMITGCVASIDPPTPVQVETPVVESTNTTTDSDDRFTHTNVEEVRRILREIDGNHSN